MVSRRGRNTSLGSGGCVDIIASCEEGAGSPAAVGQTPAVHGAAGPGVEYPSRGPRGRCVALFRGELGAWAQGLPQRCGGWVRRALGSAGSASDQLALPIAGRAHRDRRSASVRAEPSGDRHSAQTGAVDDLTGAAAQRCRRSRISPVRRSSSSHRPAGTSTPPPSRHQWSARRLGLRAAWSAVESAADQPPFASALSR